MCPADLAVRVSYPDLQGQSKYRRDNHSVSEWQVNQYGVKCDSLVKEAYGLVVDQISQKQRNWLMLAS